MSILDKGMLKCALTITDTIRNIGRTQIATVCVTWKRDNTEGSRGDSVSVSGKSGSCCLKQEGLRKLRAVCSLDLRVST